MCGYSGEKVKNQTVDAIGQISTEKYPMYICKNPVCEIVYFGQEFYPLVFKDQIKTSLHFKDDTLKYICYCHKITYEDVKFGVLKKRKRSIRSIFDADQAIKSDVCSRKHPYGCSCAIEIQQYIQFLLKNNNIY